MSGIKIQIDNQNYSATKFAGEIKLDDILKNIKNIDKCIVEAMFNDIAGEDGIIQGTELEAFMHKLENASGDDKNLTPQELEKFARSREKGIVGKFAASTRAPLYREFIKQLFNTNSQKVAQEEKAAENAPKPQIPVDKLYENGKLVKKIIHKDDGTTVEQQFKNGRLTREITTTKDGKVKDKTIDKDGNQTFHRKVKDGYTVEKFVIYDKDNKKIGEGTVNQSGTKSTNYLQDGKVVKDVTEYSDGNVLTSFYNNDGTLKESVYQDKNGYRSVTKYFYDENRNKTKEVKTDSDGTTRTSTYNEKGIQKTVEKQKDGTVKTTTYNDGKEWQPAKEVEVNSNGSKWITEYTYSSASDYEAAKIVTKDGNGKVTSTTTSKFDKEGGVIESAERDGDGKLTHVNKFDGKGNLLKSTYYRPDGDVETTTYGKNVYKSELRDKDGNLKSSTEEVKNAKGVTVKLIKKDATGQVTETTDYTSSGWVTRDGKGQIIETCETTKSANGKLQTYKNNKGQVTLTRLYNDGFTDTEYVDGKPYCTCEYNRSTDTRVYKDAQGNEVSYKEYHALLKFALHARREE